LIRVRRHPKNSAYKYRPENRKFKIADKTRLKDWRKPERSRIFEFVLFSE